MEKSSESIALLTSGHPPDDERIYHKIGKSLAANGYAVKIIASTTDQTPVDTSVEFDCFDGSSSRYHRKAAMFFTKLRICSPGIIIASEVFPLLPAFAYKLFSQKRVLLVYDSTEWYPENVTRKFDGIKKHILFFAHYIFMILTFQFADAFLSGEKGKLIRPGLWAPQKPKKIVPYYPVVDEIQITVPARREKSLHILFSGELTEPRGYYRCLEAVRFLSEAWPEASIRLTIIGASKTEEEKGHTTPEVIPGNLQIVYHGRLDYQGYLAAVASADVCLDCRDKNFTSENSLPIKVFDYLAMGKPVIYTRLRTLCEEVNIENAGFFLDDLAPEAISEVLSNYLRFPELIQAHSANARRMSEGIYNWKAAEKILADFLHEIKKAGIG